METFWTERRSKWEQNSNDARSPWETDYARIIHSSSFRRLQGKTQILNLGDSDFYRTRLTHSLEVAQIARGLIQQCKLNYENDETIISELADPTLAQAIGSTHDLGHPPFGHGGEYALNYCMRNHGGFEGNGQTLRILSRLERFSSHCGSDLTRRSLLGVLKYPIQYSTAYSSMPKPILSEEPTTIKVLDRNSCKPPKCFHDDELEIVNWIVDPIGERDRDEFLSVSDAVGKYSTAKHKSFDCSIMDLANDIAYGVHDLEDMITMGLIDKQDFEEIVVPSHCRSFLDEYAERAPTEVGNDTYQWLVDGLYGDANSKKHFISRFVGHFITNVQVQRKNCFQTPQLDLVARLPDGNMIFLKALKKLVFDKVIKSPEVQHLEFKGQSMVISVFEAYANNPERLLPTYAQRDYESSELKERVICDHIAGMTDHYLLKTYERLFSPRMGSTFDRL